MKKILFIFALLFTLTMSSQNRLSYSTELDPLMLEFVNEAAERNYFPFDEIVQEVDSILLVDFLPPEKMGFVDRENRIIYIRNRMSVIEAKITLFHELGHILTDNSHPCEKCTDIMALYGMRDHSYYEDEKVYEAELDKLFDYIKSFKK